jgi:hypothetical protein
VQQILDVRVDPAIKNRVLSGAVNVAVCPSCGMGGALNLPFIYHDPEEEAALLYLPMEVGDTEVERQQVAGRLTQQLMDMMPQEERKGYLLQPETFISLESLVKRVLELEGVTEEELTRTQEQREFLQTFLAAPEEAWDELIAEHEDLLDESFFGLLQYMMQMAGMQGAESEEGQKIQRVYEYFVEQSAMGRKLAQRTEIMQSFAENPNRQTLLNALVRAPDEETVEMLVQSGAPLLDYGFFQALVARIQDTETEEEEQRLRTLRRKILDLRQEMVEASQDLTQERMELLQRFLDTEDPLLLARSHLSELDEAFSMVLRANLEDAREQGHKEAVQALQQVMQVVNQVMEENMPPELALIRRVMMAPTEERRDQVLQANREVLQPRFFQFLESLEESSREQGDVEAAEQLAKIRTRARMYAPEVQQPTQPSAPEGPQEQPPSDSETTTPSGLIIAKH